MLALTIFGNKIWDIYKADNNWSNLFGGKDDAHHIADYMSVSGLLGGNTTNVTDMSYMFANCMAVNSMPMIDMSNVSSTSWMFFYCGLYSIPKFNTRNVVDMSYMFSHCGHLTAIPLFDTSKATNMDHTFFWTYDVQSGALAMYQQASTQATVPSHDSTFTRCGVSNESGYAELVQIPSSWGGDQS